MKSQFSFATDHLFMAISFTGRSADIPADLDVIPTKSGVIFEAGLGKIWWIFSIIILMKEGKQN